MERQNWRPKKFRHEKKVKHTFNQSRKKQDSYPEDLSYEERRQFIHRLRQPYIPPLSSLKDGEVLDWKLEMIRVLCILDLGNK